MKINIASTEVDQHIWQQAGITEERMDYLVAALDERIGSMGPNTARILVVKEMAELSENLEEFASLFDVFVRFHIHEYGEL